ncbi:MAG: PhnD/SsuA/transferrin family substrate-binding protein, partial [Sulfurimonas sp.]|nr:PhnD/SsuA/transferrin family substrate-binding protein [Sulfurimonas sp.]
MKFFLFLLILLTLNLYAKDEIHFGVYAYKGYEDTKKRYDPLVQHLNETLHKKVILEVLTQDEMNKKIAAKELDIITTSPIHFLILRHEHKLSGAIATLVAMYDDAHTNKFAGVIVVKNDSPIKTLSDIKNKIIATPNVNLLGGFRAQAYELHKSGIDIIKESKEIIELKSGYTDVIKHVLEGKSDAGFTRDGIVEQMIKKGEIKADDVRIIHEKTHKNYPFKTSTPLYPEWPIFALPHADEEDVKDFVSALFLLKSTSEHAKESKIYGYSLAADYLETEELTRELRLPPFDKTPRITLEDIWDKYNYSLIIFMLALIGALISYIQIERKKRFVESLISNMGEGVYGVDVDGNCTWINQKALDMLGFGKEEVLYKNQHTMFHHHKPSNELYSADECPINQTLQDKISREAED